MGQTLCVSFLIQGSSTVAQLTLGWIIFVVGSLLFLSGWLVVPLPFSTHQIPEEPSPLSCDIQNYLSTLSNIPGEGQNCLQLRSTGLAQESILEFWIFNTFVSLFHLQLSISACSGVYTNSFQHGFESCQQQNKSPCSQDSDSAILVCFINSINQDD